MNDPLLSDFNSDIDRVLGQIDLIGKLRQLAKDDGPSDDDLNVNLNSCDSQIGNNEYFVLCQKVWGSAKQTQSSLAILDGTLILYIAGRFEEFIQSSIEDLCDRLIQRLGSFTALPKQMQESLIQQTAKVMLEPRKYGHAENGVRTFVAVLANNFSNQSGVEQSVNSQCISITEANMRADVLADLFKRIGIKEIWKTLSQQASILAFFQTADIGGAETNAKKLLNTLMDDRNRVAHPSGSFDWPSADKVKNYANFLKVMAMTLSTLIPFFEATLGTTSANIANGAAD